MVILIVISQNIPRVTSWFVFPFVHSFPFFSFHEYYNDNDTETSQHFQYFNRPYAPFVFAQVRKMLRIELKRKNFVKLFVSYTSVTCCKICFIWLDVIGSRRNEVLYSMQYIQRVNILFCRQINSEAKT